MRKIIKTKLEEVKLTGNVSEIVAKLDKLQDKYPNQLLSVEEEVYYDFWETFLYGTRVETEQEYTDRIQQEIKDAEEKEKRKLDRLSKSTIVREKKIKELESEIRLLKGL